MESRHQKPEFRNNPENFHPWIYTAFRGYKYNFEKIEYAHTVLITSHMAIHLSGLLYNKHSTNIYLNAKTYIKHYLKWLYANRVHKKQNI